MPKNNLLLRCFQFLEPEEVKRLLDAPLKSEAPEIIKLRDRAILELLWSTGMRVSELCGLKLEDINKGFDLMHEGKSIRSVVVF